MDDYRLIKASVELHGTYNNGIGKQRKAAHEVLTSPALREEVAEAARLTLEAMEVAERSPEAKGRWGASPVKMAGRRALEAAGAVAWKLPDVALSELDPEWVMTTDLNEVVAVAGVVHACRQVASQLHALDIQSDEAD